ncbi:MAG: glutathione S-transferase C-terminal domain-containing protein [Verrucomicrobiales bacterium]|nr:glutathione S-transferase C-terminal domain-containing protein [Verrucomicrobiales bacterium]
MKNDLSSVGREQSEEGGFQRQEDAFRETDLTPARDRYHLYVSLACPWASRTVIVRGLLGLEEVIGLTVLDPIRDERGWAFRDVPGCTKDPVNGFDFLSEAYNRSDPAYRGRVTVPVLWDQESGRIVNNSEDDICRLFNDTFAPLGNGRDLFPPDLEEAHAALSEWIYAKVNNGVYRCGFATRQDDYERNFHALFAALDDLENRLDGVRYLFGERIVEADWRLFCTLVRFDAVYHGHFKCNLRRIVDYRNLHGYLLDLYQQPGIAETVRMDHIQRHYYLTHHEINPNGIVPAGPALDFEAAHDRASRFPPPDARP